MFSHPRHTADQMGSAEADNFSEGRFAAYCAARGYAATKIWGEKTRADFRVLAGEVSLIAEVKEFTANAEDKRFHVEVRAKGAAYGGDTVGRRARKAIKDAAHQLKALEGETLPGVIVLYDNIRVGGERMDFPYTDLQTFQIDAAMYGFVTAHVGLDGSPGKPDRAGRGRTTTASEKRYVSAVCVLYDLTELRMLTYHNFFASRPLPTSVFSGPNDRHLRKAADPSGQPGAWEVLTPEGVWTPAAQ